VELYLHFPSTPSWRDAQLKHKGQVYLLPLSTAKVLWHPKTVYTVFGKHSEENIHV